MLNVNINSYSYGENLILKNININFKPGYLYGIIGKNGSGKTTLLNIISGIIPNVVTGELDGKIIYNNRMIAWEDFDYVFQNSENSLFYNKVRDQLHSLNEDKINYWMKTFNMLDYKNKYTRDLSVGEKKIITCLAALLSSREIVILDEPTTNLDNKNKRKLMQLISSEKKNKIIIIVSHDKELIDLCDKLYEICDRELTEFSNNILEHKNSKKNEINTLNKDILLQFNGFTYTFSNGNVYKYNGNVKIPTNSIVAILGNNGTGKTTFANYVMANYKSFYKKGISKKKVTCSIMFQSFYKQLFEFTVKKELLFGINKNLKTFDADIILKEIGLYEKRNEDPRFISDGQKRILLICSLLMSKKDLIILDEPFDNIDFTTKIILKELLKKYRSFGSTIIILDQDATDFYEIVDEYIEL